MRIAFITAGAAGMYCGSCMRDNTLVSALVKQAHDALLIPTFTPIRTDDADVSEDRIFFGGINVYLQQKSWLFRHTPWLFDRLLNGRQLLKWVSPFAARTKYRKMGGLTISMLQGSHGHQRKEVEKLTDWLVDEVKPEVVLLTNVLLSGIIPELKQRLGVPVLATLQGDDIFLNALTESDRKKCVELIRQNCGNLDGFIVTSRSYADSMADYLGVDRARMHVVYPGLNLAGHGGPKPVRTGPPVIGYFARICPEKGFHNLVNAFIHLKRTTDSPAVLRASGWLGAGHRAFYDEQVKALTSAGLTDQFEYIDSPDHEAKVRFLNGIDILSVPTTYHEPKGLYILEAWANGVPVVQPRHGSFPELIDATGGGLLVEPNDLAALAAGWQSLLNDPGRRVALGEAGRAAVNARFTAAAMATATVDVLSKYVRPPVAA